MPEIIVSGTIRVPVWVDDLETFRRWCLSDEFVDRGNISYLNSQLWIDPSFERDIHNQIKLSVAAGVYSAIQADCPGRLYGDGMRLVSPLANLSTEPDAMFLSKPRLQQQHVQLQHGSDSREVIGSPDMVLEVVSDSSVEKDTITLLDLYHKARVREYWLVNPLGEDVEFKIYSYAPKGFVEVRPVRGWLHSEVFGKSFRLVSSLDENNLTEFTLKARG